MARHVDPDDHSFRTSVLRAAAGGLAALLITFAVTGVLTFLGRDRGGDSPAITFTGGPSAQPTEVARATEPLPPPVTEPEPTAAPPTDPPTPQEMTEASGTVTVQVLDAAGSGTHAQDAAQVLRDLGYEVVVVNSTPRRVDTTTVLFTAGHQEDAEGLRAEDERFATINENKDFSPTVDLHVLVADDFSS